VHGFKITEEDNAALDYSGIYYANICFFSKYQLLTEVAKVPKSMTEIEYFKSQPQKAITTVTDYEFKGLNHNLPTKIITTDSKGQKRSLENFYAFDLFVPGSLSISQYTDAFPTKGYKALFYKNINRLINQKMVIENSGSNDEYVNAGLINHYDANLIDATNHIYGPVKIAEVKKINTKDLILRSPSTFSEGVDNTLGGLKEDTKYEVEQNFSQYDALGNLLAFSNKQQNICFLRDYNNQYKVASVNNAAYNDVAYTSFEAEGNGNWTITDGAAINDPTAPTGAKVFSLAPVGLPPADIVKLNLTASTTYFITYWTKGTTTATIAGSVNSSIGTGQKLKSINGWDLYKHVVSGTTSVKIIGNIIIDELRLYPSNAQMTTSTFQPLVGQTCSCDPNNVISYYEYDEFNRVKLIKDQNKNIIKQYCYTNSGQVQNCN
jgi:hypothetical protein